MPFQIHMCSLFLEQTIPSIFQIVVRGGGGRGGGGKSLPGGGESEIFLGGIFLPGHLACGGNLRRSDFDNLNLFQS